MTDKLILLLYESWADLDRAVSGLAHGDATARHDGGSSIAWTLGHLANQLHSWINERFQRLPPHPVISHPRFRAGGSGEAEDWPMIVASVSEVRKAAKSYLDSSPDLDRAVPYDGSIELLRPTGLSLCYALMRIAAHHWIHTGETLTIRSRVGYVINDYPDWGRSLL